MKDRSIVWLVVAGIALWIFAAYAPVRDPIVRAFRHIVTFVGDQF